MLNILVCIKQVPDVNLVKIDPETGSLIRQGVPSILNPQDGFALEAAIQTKEKYGGAVTCITMGPDMAAEALRECLAAGADKAVLLSDRAFANADTLATSYVIATAAASLPPAHAVIKSEAKNLSPAGNPAASSRPGNFDLIFCGKESLDGATGQMAGQLAERFDASQLSCVSELLELDLQNNTVTVRRQLENGQELSRASLPCLFTVEKTNYRPRIPNLKNWKRSREAGILRLNSKTIPGLDEAQIGDPGSPTKVPRTYPPAVGEAGRMIDEGSPEKNVQKLFELIDGLL